MISDEDPKGTKKAYSQMLNCTIFNSLVPLGMALPAVGMIHPAVLAPFYFFQIKQFQALKEFKNSEASV
jgi:hypothetical protein